MSMVNRKLIFSWCLYDWANSAYSTVIGTFVFSVYFANEIYGDPTGGSVVWGYTIGGAGLVVALFAPFAGAIADHGGYHKRWVGLATAMTVFASALLFFAEPDERFVIFSLILVVIATVGFEFGTIFYNSTLHLVAPKDQLGRVSGWGWSLGYFGGLTCLFVALATLIKPDFPWFGFSKQNAENIRAIGLLVAVWVGLFAIPFFIYMPVNKNVGAGLAKACRAGLRQLRSAASRMKSNRPMVLFLVASAIYRDGLATLFAVGGLYASDVHGMTIDQIMLFAIALNFSAGAGAFVFSWVDDYVGPQQTVLIGLAGLVVFGIAILFMGSKVMFIAFSIGLGIFVGPVQAASRSLAAKLSAKDKEAEMFGFYALSGKSVAFLGPFFYAASTDAFESQRAGLVTILLAWALGGLILGCVPPRTINGGNVVSR